MNTVNSVWNIIISPSWHIKCKYILPSQISDEEIEQLRTITNSAFWITMSKEDMDSHILESKDVYLLYWDNKLVGFSSTKDFNGIVYRYGTAIHQDFQWRWIYTFLNRNFFANVVEMLLRTQNMNVINGHKRTGREVYVWNQAIQLLQAKDITQKEVEDFIGNNLSETGIFKWAYGGYLWNKDRVKYITHEDYPDFDASKWDSLLVYIK